MRLKDIMTKVLSVLICFMVVPLTSCKNPTSSGDGEVKGNSALIGKKYNYEGVHDYTAPELDAYIVQNGRTDYKILMPYTQEMQHIMAKNELVTFFKEATGITLDVVIEPESGFRHNDDNKYFSLGKTKMYQSSGLSYDEEVLAYDGVRIQTKGNTVYLNGGEQEGVVYAVYDFLQILFNYEYYYLDCWEIDKDVQNVKLREFNVTDIPDIPLRASFWGQIQSNKDNSGYRFRTAHPYQDYVMPMGDLEVEGNTRRPEHTSFNILPKNAPTSENKWYSDDGTQLCYTAHGDEESYKRMVERTAYVVERSLIDYPPDLYPRYKFGTITITDIGNSSCTCAACSSNMAKYGAASGSIIVFMNDVREVLDAWMALPENEAYRREDFDLAFFAYHAYIDAPVKYDEKTDSYIPNHEDLVLNEGVATFYASSPGFKSDNFYNAINDGPRENMVKWTVLSKNIYTWFYDVNFNHYLNYHGGARMFNSDAFQFIASNHVTMYSNQGGTGNVSAFNGLKLYLESKLAWNSNLDTEILVENWFNAMYRDVAPLMRELYLDGYAKDALFALGGVDGALDHTTDVKKQWPLQLIYRMLDIIEIAQTITKEKYEIVDPALYAMIKKHIDYEWVSPAINLLKYYSPTTSNPERYRAVIEYYHSDVEAYGAFYTDDNGGSVADIVKQAELKG